MVVGANSRGSDDKMDILRACSDLERDLARVSSVYSIRRRRLATGSNETREMVDCLVLDDAQLSSALKTNDVHDFQLLPDQPPPADHRKLQVNLATFKSLITSLNIPARFVASIPRTFQVSGTGIQKTSGDVWDYWCLVPVRVTIPCHMHDAEHANSTAGSNQMDPFNYIHIGGAKVDIRGSHVAIFLRRLDNTGRSVVVIISLLDGRWGNVVEQPLARVKETLNREAETTDPQGPLFVLLIYISSILQWWNNVLSCFHKQLVIHEKSLQEVIAQDSSAFSADSKNINKHLHTMAAHLHRYNSELNRLHYILDEIKNQEIYRPPEKDKEEVLSQLNQLVSKSNVIRSFSEELERKVQNILTLLFNQIQATNDKTLQAILLAAENEAAVSRNLAIDSHELSRSMQKDSIAMKTIAILTMAFLPGTSFAALLSMPFFDNDYMSDPAKVWIWIILTVPSTAVAFYVFRHIIKRDAAEADKSRLQVGSANTSA
ncbi:hypothetical protein F4809DRAFT_614503 [Biscogniauxia mediterranea]|nr:hypothetical protein F4809DRAFT_614503 [Biscogniauxia mediterranea]